MSARLSTVLPAPQSACLRRQLISSAPRRAFSSPARGQPLRPSPTSKPSPNSAAKRYQSTASSSDAPSRLPAILYGTAALAVGGLAWYLITDVRFSAHRYITVPALRWWFEDAEEAHHAGVKGLKVLDRIGLGPRDRCTEGGLEVEIFGHKLLNPVGTSAGIDKGAEVPDELLQLGGAYVEVGGITPLPQGGNPRPRLFRLPSQNALINRFGLNSEGADRVAHRLRQRVRAYAYHMGYGLDEEAERFVLDGEAGVPPGSLVPGKLMGVQVAKNKNTPDDIESVIKDYVYCVDRLSRYADVIVVNVSSPNTEGLRDLQSQEPLTKVLKAVVAAAQRTDRRTKPAVMVKVSPDEDSKEQVEGICDAIWDSGVDGVIVGNTTKQRPAPLPAGSTLPEKEQKLITETGGYSGPQLFSRTVALTKRYRETLDSRADGRIASLSTLPDQDLLTPPAATNAADAAPKETAYQLPKDDKTTTSPASDARDPARKVIFCSGGITNGRQALEALNAGADMVQVYTALIYGGVGTVARIKDEMREEMRVKAKTLEAEKAAAKVTGKGEVKAKA